MVLLIMEGHLTYDVTVRKETVSELLKEIVIMDYCLPTVHVYHVGIREILLFKMGDGSWWGPVSLLSCHMTQKNFVKHMQK